jgi:hypothetical protein
MKATFSLVFALILNHQVLFAQSNLSIGIIGGPMVANFWDDNNSFLPKKWMPTFSVGTALRLQLAKQVFLQTDISYERKGFSLGELEWTDFNAIPIGKATLYSGFDYLLLTPTIGYSTRGKFHFEGSIGIFGGYLIDQKSRFVSVKGDFPDTPTPQTDMSFFNRFDFGTTTRLGVGYNFSQRWSANVNVVSNFGWAKPLRSQAGQPTDSNTDKTVSLGLQFGVFYKI